MVAFSYALLKNVDKRFAGITGMENLGIEGLLREALGCPGHAGVIIEVVHYFL